MALTQSHPHPWLFSQLLRKSFSKLSSRTVVWKVSRSVFPHIRVCTSIPSSLTLNFCHHIQKQFTPQPLIDILSQLGCRPPCSHVHTPVPFYMVCDPRRIQHSKSEITESIQRPKGCISYLWLRNCKSAKILHPHTWETIKSSVLHWPFFLRWCTLTHTRVPPAQCIDFAKIYPNFALKTRGTGDPWDDKGSLNRDNWEACSLPQAVVPSGAASKAWPLRNSWNNLLWKQHG